MLDRKYFNKDDMVYDIESLESVFTVAQYYCALDILIISIIDDNNLYQGTVEQQRYIEQKIKKQHPDLKNAKVIIEKLQNDILTPMSYIEHIPYGNMTAFVKRFGAANVFNDINKYNASTNRTFIPKGTPLNTSLKELASAYIAKYQATGNYPVIPDAKLIDDVRSFDHQAQVNTVNMDFINYLMTEFIYEYVSDPYNMIWQYFDNEFYFVKMTDSIYDETKHGLRIAFNSSDYDLTMLSFLLANTNAIQVNQGLKDRISPTHINILQEHSDDGVPSAKLLREYNDNLFRYSKTQKRPMNSFISNFPSPDTFNSEEIKTSGSRFINSDEFAPIELAKFRHAAMQRNALYSSGRYLDIMPLAEKMQHCGVKRLSAYLGLSILEFEGLGSSEQIDTFEKLANLIAYNITDVYNEAVLYTQPTYQTPVKVHKTWLNKWDTLQYQLNPKDKTKSFALKYPINLKTNFLGKYNGANLETTSANFISNVIAPYRPVVDANNVDFIFPDIDVFNRLPKDKRCGHDAPFDILEDTMNWAKQNLPDHGESFKSIYNMYKSLMGRSNNPNTQRYKDDEVAVRCLRNNKPIPPNILQNYTDGNVPTKEDLKFFDNECHLDTKAVMESFETEFQYLNADGTLSPFIAKLGIGGMHSSEFDLDILNELNNAYQLRKDEFEKKKIDYQTNMRRLKIVQQKYNSPEDAKLVAEEVCLDEETNEMFAPKAYVKRTTKKTTQASWREFKEPKKAPKAPDIKNAAFISTGKHYHADFEGYYPTLSILLGIFYDKVRNRDIVSEEKANRAKHKAQANAIREDILENDYPKEILEQKEKELSEIDTLQLAEKLFQNSGTGKADVKSKSGKVNNFALNNKILKMRIIGQLITWRVSQALVLNGCGVTSGNTDGVYTYASIEFDKFAQIVEETIAPLFITIEPEIVDNFISKDSNNRIEMVNGKIARAAGGMLRSYKGPQKLTSTVDHPCLYDAILVEYLTRHPDATNNIFDINLGKQIIGDFKAGDSKQLLNLTQWVLQSSDSTHRYIYGNVYQNKLDENGHFIKLSDNTEENIKLLPRTNRVFLIKRPTDPNEHVLTLNLATKSKVELKKRRERKAKSEKELQNNDISKYVIVHNNDESILKQFEYEQKECVVQKVKDMPIKYTRSLYNADLDEMLDEELMNQCDQEYSNQPVLIENRGFDNLTEQERQKIIEKLDLNAYLEIAINKFYGSWCNIKTIKNNLDEIKTQLSNFSNSISL